MYVSFEKVQRIYWIVKKRRCLSYSGLFKIHIILLCKCTYIYVCAYFFNIFYVMTNSLNNFPFEVFIIGIPFTLLLFLFTNKLFLDKFVMPLFSLFQLAIALFFIYFFIFILFFFFR